MTQETKTHTDIMERASNLTAKELDGKIVADDELNQTAGSGTNDLKFNKVEPGYVLKVFHLSGYDDTSAPTKVRVGYYNGKRLNWVKTQPSPLVSETVEFNGELRLGEGMYPIVRLEGCTSGDDIYATLNGYLIKR